MNQTGVTFFDTRFDDATCHIAYGAGLPFLSNEPPAAEALLDAGVNVSSVHTDFMVGELDVTSRESASTVSPSPSSATTPGKSERRTAVHTGGSSLSNCA